jgi:hypothetical protein
VTLPDERSRAIKWARGFLISLMRPKETPKVPLRIRQRARSILKHYIGDYEVEKISKCKKCGEILGNAGD